MATYNNGISLVPGKVTIVNGSYTVPTGHVFIGMYFVPASSTLNVDGQIFAGTAAGTFQHGQLFAGAGAVISCSTSTRVTGFLVKNLI